jgi:DNA-directed RNA polymerase subunit beta
VLADLHDERTNKKLLTKGDILNRDIIELISTRNLKRIRYADKDPRVNEQIDEIEEMTSRQIDVLRKITNEKIGKMQKGDELSPGVIKMVKVYIAMKRKLSRAFFLRKTCRTCPMERRWRSYSIRLACLRV